MSLNYRFIFNNKKFNLILTLIIYYSLDLEENEYIYYNMQSIKPRVISA